MNFQGSFGGWLKQRRKALDLTQAELADQVGCTVTTIQKIESDLRRPSKQIAERLAEVLAISDDDRATFITYARRLVDLAASPTVQLTSPVPTSNLPVPSTPFLGREDELTQIATRLADPTCRLLTLVGGGGIGKTRLALQAASQRREDFTDGVYFVSLTPIGSTTLIGAAIANALQLSFYGQESPDVLVVNYLREKNMLLVMDNYEHLLAGIELLAELLAKTTRLKILVTSRERLNLTEEWVLPVEGLSFPMQLTGEEFSSYASVQLFEHTARRLQPGFSLEHNRDSIIDICRTVEGMPLGIELAVSWLRAMPCDQIARQIRQDLDFLTTPLRNMPDRHRSLRAVFEHSWDLLSDDERNVLMKLSVFHGGIDPEAAKHVAQASLPLLAGLVDKSLIRLNTANRYDMHELLRQFAAEKLQVSNLSIETKQAHFQYFLEVGEQLRVWFFGYDHAIRMDYLAIELDNFRAALDWAAQSMDTELGLRLAGGLGWFWNRRGYWNEGRMWLEKFLELGGNVSVSIQALAYHHALELNIELGNKERVEVLFNIAQNLVSVVNDPWYKAWLLNSLGFADYVVPSLHDDYHEQALDLFTKLDDKWGICETLSRLAWDQFQYGNFAPAEKLQNKAIRLARQQGDKSVLSWLLLLSAYNHWLHGRRNDYTENLFIQSLGLFRELGYKNGMAGALLHLGKFARLHDDFRAARTHFEESLKIMRQISGGDYNVWCLINLAEINCTDGQPEQGAQLLGALEADLKGLWQGDRLLEKEGQADYEQALAAAHAQLDDVTFAAAYAQGQMMTLDQALAYALTK